MLKVYLNYVENPDQKEKIKQWLERCFGILTSWIGEEGKVFVKAQAGETPVGYSTMEVLDDEQTRIALHQSPLLPEYMPQLPEGIAYMKTLFPNAKAAYTSASTKKLQEFVKQVGFKEDDSYVPNKELLPDPKGYIGFRKDFGDTK